MKTTATILLLASCIMTFGQGLPGGFVMGGGPDYAKEARDAQIQDEFDRKNALTNIPWRVVDGQPIHVSDNWIGFYGTVLEVQPHGIRVDGNYRPLKEKLGGVNGEFFVTNFIGQVAEGDTIEKYQLAMPHGLFTYQTVTGGSRTIHCLDFGVPYVPPPPTPEQLAALTAANAAKAAAFKTNSAAAQARALKSNQDAAATNDAYGLLRMGERYRDGDGVAKDLPKAREYFTNAIAAGNTTAKLDLESLPK